MKKIFSGRKIFSGFSIVLLSVLALTACKPADAPEPAPEPETAQPAGLVFERGWIRSLPPGMKMTAGFGVLTNKTAEAIELVSFASPTFQVVELHMTEEKNGFAGMKRLDSMTVQPGEKAELMPGGYHLMLMGPKQSMAPGSQVLIQMTSTSGQTFEFEVAVENR